MCHMRSDRNHTQPWGMRCCNKISPSLGGIIGRKRWPIQIGAFSAASLPRLVEAGQSSVRNEVMISRTARHTTCRERNSGTTWNGVVGGVTVSPTWSMSAEAALPMNLEPSRMCTTRLRSNPIKYVQVASAATGSSASTILPSGRGVPFRGPFPSIATMPSAITKWMGTVAHKSRMLS